MVRICLQCRRPEFGPWVGKIPCRRECQTTPVFLPRESHAQRRLEGFSLRGHRVGPDLSNKPPPCSQLTMSVASR